MGACIHKSQRLCPCIPAGRFSAQGAFAQRNLLHAALLQCGLDWVRKAIPRQSSQAGIWTGLHAAVHQHPGVSCFGGWLTKVRGQFDQEGAVDTGTTIVAVSYKDGVVLGADSRVSTGIYISNRASDKLTPLNDSVWLLRSGSAADTQLVADYVRHFTNQLAMELTEEPDVKSVASLVKQLNYNNKAMLLGAMIVAGWDKHGGGQVWGCPISGTLVQEKWAIDGSGSTYIWGLLDAEYRDGMSREDAERLVIDAIALAMARDGSSGGMARLVTINQQGCHKRQVKGDQIPLFWNDLEPGNGNGMVIV